MKIKESEKKDKYLDLAKELKKPWHMKVTVISIVVSALGTITKMFSKRDGNLGNMKINRDRQNYTIIKIGQNT